MEAEIVIQIEEEIEAEDYYVDIKSDPEQDEIEEEVEFEEYQKEWLETVGIYYD
jgi:hypothetical protein